MAVFIVLWPYLLTTKLKSVIRHNLGHSKGGAPKFLFGSGKNNNQGENFYRRSQIIINLGLFSDLKEIKLQRYLHTYKTFSTQYNSSKFYYIPRFLFQFCSRILSEFWQTKSENFLVAKDRTFVRQSARRTVSQKFQTLYHANQYV